MLENKQYWFYQAVKAIDTAAVAKAEVHQACLTKPLGALGELENIAIKFAGWQGRVKPNIEYIGVRVFAGDHGVCDKGVSAFPQEVTVQMVANFVAGGAAISVLSRDLGADFSVVNMGTVAPLLSTEGVIDAVVADGTQDFSEKPAMNQAQCLQALNSGKQLVDESDWDLFIGGEMGIGNTSSASALYCALLDISPELAVGPGTGIDEQGVKHKAKVIAQALDCHGDSLSDPLSVLQCVGGFEIAALVGAYIACAQKGVPILVDGFICSAAALVACKLNPQVRDWMLFSHRSAEPAHIHALAFFAAKPLLDLSLRLGEGSGAAVAVPLIKSALSLHANMATFAQAGVSDKSE